MKDGDIVLPDEFIFKVDSTDILYHCIRRNNGDFDLRYYNRQTDIPAVWSESDLEKNMGDGWTIVDACAEDEDTSIDIANMI